MTSKVEYIDVKNKNKYPIIVTIMKNYTQEWCGREKGRDLTQSYDKSNYTHK